MTTDFVVLNQQTEPQQLICQGAWILTNLKAIKKQIRQINWNNTLSLTIDGKAINQMDTSGIWELQKLINHLNRQKITFSVNNFHEEHLLLLKMIATETAELKHIPQPPRRSWLYRLGQRTVEQIKLIAAFLAFAGEISLVALNLLCRPWRIRWRSLLSIIEITGYQALPIIALLSFMIGVVLTYQMGLQLRTYGANIFIVDLLGFSIFREFGPLLTAIIIAGRTGSAFTAQLGTMVLNEEVDALRTMGIAPAELLVLPKLFGLLITMPLLSMWANLFGLLGGMLMAKGMLGVTFYDFFERFAEMVSVRSLWIGLFKTPIFALIVASVGCFQGMQVAGGADSIGRHTTRSVVQIIFCVIITDTLFSILFTKLGL